jgi:hypothetical protein
MALAFIPRLDIPTVIGGNHVEGGVAVPFAIKLSKKAELETMTEYDFIHNDTGSGYHVEYLNSASLYDAIGTQNPLGGIVTLNFDELLLVQSEDWNLHYAGFAPARIHFPGHQLTRFTKAPPRLY